MTTGPEVTPGPFAGLRVVDLSRALAGPYCTMMMGDLGADVIKVEDRFGDESRQWPPFANGMSAMFLAVNRNKRSICLDLRSDDGRRLLRELIAMADVLIENFRTGVAEQLGLDYPSVQAINSNIIHCSISGFGRTGPLSDTPAYDSTMQAFGGLMSCTGEQGGRPVRAGYSVVDISTGLLAYSSILSALFIRARGGPGQHVETSLLDSQIALVSSHA
ncbi:MAG: CaiB/BaiF CoA transferase family protein, partial [Thermoanaerobaculia bacterium]